MSGRTSRRFERKFLQGATAILAGAVLVPSLSLSQAKADFIENQIIQNVIQNILQNVRDQIQRRELVVPPVRALRFSGDDENSASSAETPFSALAYASMPTKAPPMVAPTPSYLYGLNLTGSADDSRASGITTTTFGVTGAVDITKLGVFTTTDAFTVIFTGSGLWSHATGLNSDTGVGAGTIAYTNGGFSTDLTIDPNWTRARLAAAGVVVGTTTMNTSGISYAPNVHYKFDLANAWFIEPTVGLTYTQTFTEDFGTETGHSTEVHGAVRIGTETLWNGVRVQPSLTGGLFGIADQSGVGGAINPATPGLPASGGGTPATGKVGGQGSGKLNILWTNTFSSYIEVHGSGIANTTDVGATGGLRWTF